ncbi:Protein phosphatase 1 regulatory subunit 14D [Trichoplax sp. H2]|uniref:Uncharacterized protein n=1 Tax=Trichoplax adhaerens TaxID=10228 RepID=B3SDK2_TRIAD|nr:hypothetical protein TRIADDRAFT_62361 [Trichoplax adhaerens]EDV19193.1 hypothetical protein TRIADDRAFT_62361 [Trichoplax adhaerens]RDD38955.1 Protein phosphatase 1 regulatory subunit 14D [Trichoplax sp. H2]|eukprot:XP_002118313.1 hypothetical protein TRIADDRAFT_62361 [Trichoplax adhaerens]
MASRKVKNHRILFQDKIEDNSSKKFGTGKYNRKALDAILKCEFWVEEQIRELYHVEDYKELPVHIDVYALMDITDSTRQRNAIEAQLRKSPSPKENFVNVLMGKLEELHHLNN